MYQTQELKPSPSFTYLSQQPPALHFAEPTLHPPGTDPFGYPGTYPLTQFVRQTQYYEDPNAGSSSWLALQAAQITYEPGSLVSTSTNSLGNSYWSNQSLVNDVSKGNGNQPMRCEVCNIDCNSRDVFEKHISGKKHLRNMQSKLNPTASSLQNSYGAVNGVSLLSQIGSTSGQSTIGASDVAASQELKMKRQKLLDGGAPVDSVKICTICNIACNGQEAYSKHLYGKKHAAQAGLMSLNGVGQYFEAIKAQNNSFWSKVPKKTKLVQSAWCEVCKIKCNSSDVYVKHLQGKKHKKNLETFGESKIGACTLASTATNSIIGPIEKPDANKSKGVDSQSLQKRATQSQLTIEDLETKKRKVVEGGAAAGAVRVCTICNVVCNSEKVFSYHLAGQKHAAMMKKQAESSS